MQSHPQRKSNDRVHEGYVELNKIFTQVCGAYLSGVIVLALFEFLRTRENPLPLILFSASVLLNIAVSLLFRRLIKPLNLELIRIYLVTGPVATYIFIVGGGFFQNWWISHLVMVLYSTVVIYSLTESKRMALWQNLYWVFTLIIANLLCEKTPLIWSSIICLSGLFLMLGVLMLKTMQFVTASLAQEADLFARHRAMFEDNPVGIVTINSDLQYVSANKAFQEFIGYSEAELQDLKMTDLTHPDERPVTEKRAKALLETAVSLKQLEKRYIHKSGQIIWGLVSSHPLKNANDKSYFLLSSIDDITDIKRRESELKLEQAKLVASSRMVEIGMMASGVAHEINNPLAIIQGNTNILMQLLENGELSKEKTANVLAKISLTVERIAKIVGSLKVLSRDGSNDPFEMASVDSMIEETLTLCGAKMKDSGVEIRAPETSGLTIPCRAGQVGQILLNLVFNAYDAVSGKPSPWIELSIKHDATFVHIMVRDSGNGIPASVVEKMMLPFFTTKPVGSGTGLGLCISQSIAENHGGQLRYELREGHTCFALSLPLRHARNLN